MYNILKTATEKNKGCFFERQTSLKFSIGNEMLSEEPEICTEKLK